MFPKNVFVVDQFVITAPIFSKFASICRNYPNL